MSRAAPPNVGVKASETLQSVACRVLWTEIVGLVSRSPSCRGCRSRAGRAAARSYRTDGVGI